MPDNDAWVSKDDVADLEGLFERLKNYQNALVHKYPFATSSRAEAAVAFGTARPALERLYPGGTDGVTQMVGALRIVRPTDDHDAVLAEVERAIQDLGALIVTVKRQLKASSSVQTPIATQPAHTPVGAAKDTGPVSISSPDERKRDTAGREARPPQSFQEAILATVWPRSPIVRVVAVLMLIGILGLFAVWESLTDAQKESVIGRPASSVSP